MKRILSFLIVALIPSFAFSAKSTTPAGTTSAATQSKTYVLNVVGMTCGDCAQKVEASIMKLDGVQGVSVDYHSGRTVVIIKPTAPTGLKDLKAAVQSAGYEVKG